MGEDPYNSSLSNQKHRFLKLSIRELFRTSFEIVFFLQIFIFFSKNKILKDIVFSGSPSFATLKKTDNKIGTCFKESVSFLKNSPKCVGFDLKTIWLNFGEFFSIPVEVFYRRVM
jgi:hypothetical protein